MPNKTIIIGVGSAGSHAVNHIKDYFDDQIEFILADTDPDTFEDLLDPYTFARGLSTDVFENEDKKVKPVFYIFAKNMPITKPLLLDALKADTVFVVCWIGWGTSNTPGLANYISKVAKEGGAKVNVLALLPLEEKAELRESIKDSRKIRSLKNRSDDVILLDSNEIPGKPIGLSEEQAFEYLRPTIVQRIMAKL
jgi:cell division GTPase FtsZ